MGRPRPAARGCRVGTFLAVTATVCTGRRSASETSATITGVAAALTSVPGPHSRDAANEATADATAAMQSVCSEMPPPEERCTRDWVATVRTAPKPWPKPNSRRLKP